MPIYEYRCQSCSNRFEVLTSFEGRESKGVCPVCASARTQVQVSRFAASGSADGAPEFGGGGGCACGGSCSCSN
ncbi:MAG TPA: zinc ribbon domain-containing protein [Candidatus Nitrosotalea sp.]|nr:zinc ribbon domain-containing protein [Candidatus Nitrosotalea sp.]